MQFFDTTTKQGLCQDADWISGTTTDSYPLPDKARRANQWLRAAGVWIWEAVSDWSFDDSNYTSLPQAERDLVDDTEDYTLPTDIFGLERVEVKDINGNWIRLTAFDDSQIDGSISEWHETKGIPRYCDVVGNSLIIKPAADLTKMTETLGLRIFVSRDTDDFEATDTTKKPGFNEMFHQLISFGMAHDYAMKIGNVEKAIELKRIIFGDPTVKGDEGVKGDMKAHYSARHDRDFKNKIRPKKRSHV